jgi:hypothetical protein
MNEYSNNTKMIPALKTRIFSNGGPYPQGKLSSLRSDLPDDLANARSSQVGRAGPQRKSVTRKKNDSKILLLSFNKNKHFSFLLKN